jgi:uncharacterized protein YjcR
MADRSAWDTAVRFEAMERYIMGCESLAAVAAAVGVPESTVEKWSAEDGWPERRKTYRRTEVEIREKEVLARAALVDRIIAGSDMAAFGFAGLQGAVLKAREVALKEEAARVVVAQREIRTPAEAVAALEEALQGALSRMLVDPQGVSLARLKELKGVMELIEELKAKHAPKDKAQAGEAGMSEDLRSKIRGALGIPA